MRLLHTTHAGATASFTLFPGAMSQVPVLPQMFVKCLEAEGVATASIRAPTDICKMP